MSKKRLLGMAVAGLLLVVGIVQFIPAAPVVIPAQLSIGERNAHRLLNFEGIANFRDLGGYPAADGQQVKWGVLYRTGTLAHASYGDLAALDSLQLKTLVDFRSSMEKEEEPNRLPEPLRFDVVEIPTLDAGNQSMVEEIFERIETGNFEGFDPDATMVLGNQQFADEFTPQFRQFVQEILKADGAPVAWHCSAGKDRTGYASAILLRILGVEPNIVMQDYMASREPSLASRKNDLRLLRLFKGDEAADKLAVLMGVEERWLNASFDEIDATWGGFEAYVRDGLQLTEIDVAALRAALLTSG